MDSGPDTMKRATVLAWVLHPIQELGHRDGYRGEVSDLGAKVLRTRFRGRYMDNYADGEDLRRGFYESVIR